MISIEIDWDVNKAITLRRETEDVTANDVLRALFGFPPNPGQNPPSNSGSTSGGGWKYGGAFFPNGTEFRANYAGKLHTGKVIDGVAIINGEQVYSPSEAAQKITGHARNGWFFWECRQPGQSAWRIINELRSVTA